MRFGLPISLACHVALVAWALISISATRQLREPEVVSIAVELVTIAEKTDLRQGSSKAKPEPVKAEKKDAAKPVVEEEKKKRVATLAPAKAEEAIKKDEAKKEEPKKEEPKKEEPKKEEPKKDDPIAKVIEKELEKDKKKKEEAKKEAKKEKKDEPKKAKSKDKFDPDKVAALLNKLPDAASPDKAVAEEPAPNKVKKKSQLGVENGSGQKLTVSEVQALVLMITQKIEGEQCWTPPVGGTGADQLTVRLRFKLERDGSLRGVPKVVNADGSPLFDLAAESAVRAIMQCQPYDMLPQEKYDYGWNDVTLNFRPSEMFGG